VGWKTRRNGSRYYYRSRREGDRVISEYVGAGPAAETAAAEHTARCARRTAAREETRRLDAIARDLAEQRRIVDGAVAAALEATGYHRHHRGEWRKRRHAQRTGPG
jgi:hypothetical protein